MSSVDASTAITQEAIDAKARWHLAQRALPLQEKVRILLELQRQEAPLLRRLRSLKHWEQPWPIEP
jgi:hypothetical protein